MTVTTIRAHQECVARLLMAVSAHEIRHIGTGWLYYSMSRALTTQERAVLDELAANNMITLHGHDSQGSALAVLTEKGLHSVAPLSSIIARSSCVHAQCRSEQVVLALRVLDAEDDAQRLRAALRSVLDEVTGAFRFVGEIDPDVIDLAQEVLSRSHTDLAET